MQNMENNDESGPDTRTDKMKDAPLSREVTSEGADLDTTDQWSKNDLPKPPEWLSPKLGPLARFLIKVAGVDLGLAERMPADEQQQMKRVGLALLFGVTFQGICFGTALLVGYGFHWWSLPVTVVLCGIMWAYDTKFVGADWASQGAGYCRSHRLITDAPWWERWSRPVAAFLRWTMSLFIALTLAIFVLLHLFATDIEGYLRGINRAQNSPFAAEATRRYQAVIEDVLRRSDSDNERLKQLSHERVALLEQPTTSSTIDAQIAERLVHIKTLEAAKMEAEARSAAHAQGAQAELRGVRATPDNTGIRGKGTFYQFHTDMMKQENSLVQQRDHEIANANTEIAELRVQLAGNLADASNTTRERLRDLDETINQTQQDRANLGAERKRLEDGKESWIADHMKSMNDYVPMPSGILAKLTGLWIIIAGNSLVASLVFSVKVVVMLLESAGPVAKMFFTKSGIYQMTVALRLHDATETELDRRTKWQHWREMQRSRSRDAIKSITSARRSQETRDRAMDAVDKIVRRFAWLH